MSQDRFSTQDEVEYVYREEDYHRSSGFRRLKNKLGQLKIYVVITIIAAIGGAGVSYLSTIPMAESGGMENDMMKKFNTMSDKQKKALRKQYGQ